MDLDDFCQVKVPCDDGNLPEKAFNMSRALDLRNSIRTYPIKDCGPDLLTACASANPMVRMH